MHSKAKDDRILRATAADKRRFWQKVDKTADCWRWMAGKHKDYGNFWVQGATVRAHRAAKIWSCKKAFSRMLCCHSCNNPSCVKPAHIYWGTEDENGQDRIDAGVHFARVKRGSQLARAKLNEKTAQEIVDAYARGGISAYTLAKRYQVSRGSIDQLLRGKSWAHCIVKPKISDFAGRKGYARGEYSYNAKFTEDNIRQMRRMRKAGYMYKDIAVQFDTTATMVCKICLMKAWCHVA